VVARSGGDEASSVMPVQGDSAHIAHWVGDLDLVQLVVAVDHDWGHGTEVKTSDPGPH